MATIKRDARWERPLSERPLKEKIMGFLRYRAAAGLDPFADLDMIQTATRADRSDVSDALAALTARARVVVDHGPQGLADQRQPDRWKIAT